MISNKVAKRVLVVYYTQTGQIKKITDSVLSVLISSGIEIEYAEIQPQPAFPFPWSYDQFFQAFPESVKGIHCEIIPIKTKYENYDLIVLAYQPWYLSPSIPIHSFLKSQEAGVLLKNKPVITIIGCRNMWVMAQEKIKQYLHQHNARLVGNIVLYDKAPNLLSVVSIVRWLVKGKQEKYLGIVPPAGVSAEDIENASHFGVPIYEALESNNYEKLQGKLNSLDAVKIKPNLLMLEKNGSRIFAIWASLILRQGSFGDPKRLKWVRAFKYYLFIVLFLISPVANLIYFLMRPFIYFRVRRNIRYYSQNEI